MEEQLVEGNTGARVQCDPEVHADATTDRTYLLTYLVIVA